MSVMISPFRQHPSARQEQRKFQDIVTGSTWPDGVELMYYPTSIGAYGYV